MGLRYIEMELSTPYVGTTIKRYFKTDMSDNELHAMYLEEIMAHNESYGYDYAAWIEDNVDDITDEEYDEYWIDYEASICEQGYWEEVDPTEEDYLDAEWEEI